MARQSGCRIKGMTVQEYRESYPYRAEYFKHNPGLFGNIWFCSICHKVLIGKKNVEVDHIRPLNKGGRNHVSNCTSTCKACNRSKSDKVDDRMYAEYTYKAVENIAVNANKGIGAGIMLALGITGSMASGATRIGVKTTKTGGFILFRVAKGILSFGTRALLFPVTHGTFMSRLAFVAIYAMVTVNYIANNTTLLNAWL